MTAPDTKGQDAEAIPILLGLDGIEGNNGLIQTDPTHRCLSFPGPGGYTINWAPGAMHIPLHPTHSGHLAVPLGAYDEVKASSGGVERQPVVLHADGPMGKTEEGHFQSETQAGPMEPEVAPDCINQTSASSSNIPEILTIEQHTTLADVQQSAHRVISILQA